MNNAQTHLKMGYVWTICLVAACGGLLFGYDWVVIGGAKPFYEAWFSITDPAQSGWAMSSAWGTAVASSFDMFVVYRIVGGVGIGLASALSPLYIAEVSPAEKRGRFVAINQLTIVIGVLAAQLINLMIAEPVATGATQQMIVDTWNGQMGWRWMFGAELVPALAFLVLMFFVPESPRWLMKAGKPDRARAALERIGSADYATGYYATSRTRWKKITIKSPTARCWLRRLNRSLSLAWSSPSSSSGAELTSSLTTRRRFLPQRDSILTVR